MMGSTTSVPAPADRLSVWGSGPHETDTTVEVGDIWRIVWYRRAIIATFALALLAVALVYSLLTPALYSASAEILIDPRDKLVLTNNINPDALPPDGGVAQVESQLSVIGSSSVLLRAIAATKLTEDPEFAGSPGVLGRVSQAFRSLLGDTAADRTSAAEVESRTLRALKGRLAIKRADKVFVIAVTVTAKSAAKAAAIANAIADAYLTDQSNARANSATEASESLAARLDEQRRKVSEAESKVERYRAENNITAANGVLVTDQQLTEVSNQLTTARSRTAELLTRMNQIEAARRSGTGSDTAEALQSAVVTQLRAREAALVEREADLRTQLGARHPTLVAVGSQLADVRSLIARELDRLTKSAKADYERAKAYEANLAASLDQLKAQAETSNQASVRLRELQREAEASRTVYNSFLLRAQETREQAGIDTTNARIITRAMPPLDKSWPPTAFLLLGAIGGGLGLGAGFALLRQYVDPIILSRPHAQHAIGAPVIGVWPESSPRRRLLRRRAPDRSDGPLRLAVDATLRRLADIRALPGPGIGFSSLMIASGRGNDPARALVARRLAFAAASRGDRVLYLDAAPLPEDQPRTAGLQDILRGETSLDAVGLIERESGITIVGAGTPRGGVSDMARSAAARRLLIEAKRRYHLVILDAGALADNSDVGPLLPEMETILFVAQTGETTEGEVVTAREALEGSGRSITAGVLVERAGRG